MCSSKTSKKVAMVTGGASGIGTATCRRFAREGYIPVIVDVNLEAAEPLAAELGGMAVQTDVTSYDACVAAAKKVYEAYGRIDILVATDIVSRGIDIDDIRLVINYDAPRDCEDYVHRIGRTARAGADGCAITFVAVDDQSRFAAIEEFIGREVHKLPLPEGLGEAPEYNPQKKSGGHGKSSRRGCKGSNHRGGKGHRKQTRAQGKSRGGKHNHGSKSKNKDAAK